MISLPTTQGSAWDAYKILAGGYDIPFLQISGNPKILDIGANVGAFSMWARQKWPQCMIKAFEPTPVMWPYFMANNPGTELIQKAVWPDRTLVLHTSDINPNANSLIKQKWHDKVIEVECVHPQNLPYCDILKMDTEGAELEILKHYPHKPVAILLEAHSKEDRIEIENHLQDYEWVLGEMWTRGVTEMKFVRKDVLTNHTSHSEES